MIPGNEDYEETEDGLLNDFDIENVPSRTYAANTENSRLIGRVDEIEAVKQAVLKIINTERYEHEIYSWDYGVELHDLFGKPMPYVMSEVKQRITDALIADDRIGLVGEFIVERVGKNVLHCAFTVTTKQGAEIQMESEVKV